jgi:hypothetical protein
VSREEQLGESRTPSLWCMKPIDLPQACERDLYSSALERLVAMLSKEKYVDAVYQVGSVRHPGISDIDLLVVVADEATSTRDPREQLSTEERYLFTHSCFVVPVSLAPNLARYVLLHRYQLLHGPDWRWEDDAGTARALEVQTALEFLAKNLVDLYVQLTYRLLKVRVFLQHLKGMKLDLEITGVEDSRLTALLERATTLTDNWFLSAGSASHEVADIAVELLPPMREAVGEATRRHAFFAPAGGAIAFAPNIVLESGPTVELVHHGIRLPRLPGLGSRRYFNAHHRLNRFTARMPMSEASPGSYHAARFDFLRAAKAFAADRFPAYAAPIPPLFYRAL